MLGLSEAQSNFVSTLIAKMAETGLEDLVEWKKPKILTIDQETQCEQKVYLEAQTQSIVLKYSDSLCQTDEKKVIESSVQTHIDSKECQIQTEPKDLKETGVATEVKVEMEVGCMTEEWPVPKVLESKDIQTDEIVEKELPL